jgi:hypothetical protein
LDRGSGPANQGAKYDHPQNYTITVFKRNYQWYCNGDCLADTFYRIDGGVAMIVEFAHTLIRQNLDFEVMVEYTATRYSDDVDIDIVNVTHEGEEIETSSFEDLVILQACIERLDEDFEDSAASEGDYRYDQAKHDY